MTKFRPCIDLHAGAVKQIVGGTLSIPLPTTNPSDPSSTTLQTQSVPELEESLRTNFTSNLPSSYYADLYRTHKLKGGHVIMLGPGNEDAAREALRKWPGGLQVGGGITDENASEWIDAGAEKIIITSFIFPDRQLSIPRLQSLLKAIDNDPEKLVLDLSCRRVKETWYVAMNKWQTITSFEISQESIKSLEPYCSEFLIHAADHEGLQAGIDEELVAKLAQWCTIPVTYAGGGRNLADLENVKWCSNGKVDLTIGSALDIFGGSGVTLEECVSWNRKEEDGDSGVL